MRQSRPGYIRFRDGTQVEYEVPRDTRDPRYDGCIMHHPACDCREALFNEDIGDYRAELLQLRMALKDVLAGHATCCCKCTGCQVARRMQMTFVGGGRCCGKAEFG